MIRFRFGETKSRPPSLKLWGGEQEGGLGVYSRPTVPRPVNTGDSHFCNRPTIVPRRPGRPSRQISVGRELSSKLVKFVSSLGIFKKTLEMAASVSLVIEIQFGNSRLQKAPHCLTHVRSQPH
jgi:hypothetical protein